MPQMSRQLRRIQVEFGTCFSLFGRDKKFVSPTPPPVLASLYVHNVPCLACYDNSTNVLPIWNDLTPLVHIWHSELETSMKSERIVVQVEPALKKALEDYSKESGVLVSEFVRRAIIEALKKVKK